MKIRARQGVCIGVDKHLKAGEEADLDGAVVTFLTGIGAVELVKDETLPVPATEQERAGTSVGADAGLASGQSKSDSSGSGEKTAPGESGKKKK